MLARDVAVAKFKKNRSVVTHLTAGGKVLDLHGSDAEPIDLQRYSIPIRQHIRNRIRLAFKELPPTFSTCECFGQIGHRPMWRNPIWHFCELYVSCEESAQCVSCRSSFNSLDVLARDIDIRHLWSPMSEALDELLWRC